MQEKTLLWLQHHDAQVGVRRILMRPEGDYRPDTELKGAWLEECGEDRPTLVYEDRPRMVSFWRGHGIHCCDVGGIG